MKQKAVKGMKKKKKRLEKTREGEKTRERMESCKNVARVTISEEQYVADWISTLFNSSPSRSLSFPLPSSFVLLLLAVCSFESCSLSPLVLFSRASACTARHIHRQDGVTYTVPVVQIAGNCSPRRGLSSSASVEGREGEGQAEVESV